MSAGDDTTPPSTAPANWRISSTGCRGDTEAGQRVLGLTVAPVAGAGAAGLSQSLVAAIGVAGAGRRGCDSSSSPAY